MVHLSSRRQMRPIAALSIITLPGMGKAGETK